MQIINHETAKAGYAWHIITTETIDRHQTRAIIYKPMPGAAYISLVAGAEIAGISETGVRDYLKKAGATPMLFTVPAEVNGTGQNRKIAFILAETFSDILDRVDPRENSIRNWFSELHSCADVAIPNIRSLTNVREAAIIEEKARTAETLLENPDSTPAARIDFDPTGGIEQLNRIVSNLDAPYHIRSKALQIQDEINHLAGAVAAINNEKAA